MSRTKPVTMPGGLPLLGHVMRLARDPLSFLQSVRLQGDVVQIWIGPKPVYVVNCPRAIQEMQTTDADAFEKGLLFDRVRGLLGESLLTSSGQPHMRQRRAIQPAFRRETVDAMAATMADAAASHCAAWRPGQIISLGEEMSRLTLDVLLKTLFRGGDMDREHIRDFHRAVPVLQRMTLPRVLNPFPALELLPLRINREYDDAVDTVHRVIRELVRRSRQAGNDTGSLLAVLCERRHSSDGSAMSEQQVHDELVAFIIAGAETTAVTLSWLFYEMSRHPGVERRVHEEVDATRGATEGAAGGITYLDWVLRETLRLHTPNWLLTRRAVRDVKVGGFPVPAGSEILFSPTTLHRDPRIYPNPLEFDPERWSLRQGCPREAFIPFGQGKRKCIGDHFAWTEMLAVSAVLSSRWRLTSAAAGELSERVGGTVYPPTMHMEVHPRSHTPST